MPDVTDPIRVKIVPDEITIDGKKIVLTLVSLGITFGSMALLVYMERKLSGPDVFLTMKMRALHGVQEYADNRARFWHGVSARATDAYLASRL
jgi:hypothetical protein